MKAHLTKVSLALLSAAFLLGCQEQGSEPVGPEGLEIQAKPGSNKGKGDGSSTLARLTITGGMTKPDDERLVAFGDGKNGFSIQAHDNVIGKRIKLRMNLIVTKCEPKGTAINALLDKLKLKGDPADPRRQVFITVGKDGEDGVNNPDDHKIGVFWDEDDGSFRMALRPNEVETNGKFESGNLMFTFKGGTVVLRDVTEKRPKDRIKVTCDLTDDSPDIVMVLEPA